MPTIFDLLIPFAVALLLLLAGHSRRGAGVALAMAIAASYPVIVGAIPQFPVVDAKHWLFFNALIAGAASLIVSIERIPKVARLILSGAVVIGCLALFSQRWLTDDQQRQGAILQILCIGLVAVGWLVSFRFNFDSPRVLSAALLLTGLLCAAVVGMSHAIVFGRLGMAAVSALAALLIVASVDRQRSGETTVVVFVAFFATLVCASFNLADLTVLDLCLVGSGPLLVLPLGSMRFRRSRPVLFMLLSSMVLILPALIAALRLLPGFLRSLSDDTPYVY